MLDIRIGDIVARKSYGQDVYFKVVGVREEEDGRVLVLRGICCRIEADAPESDLVLPGEKSVLEHMHHTERIVEEKCREIRMAEGRCLGNTGRDIRCKLKDCKKTKNT